MTGASSVHKPIQLIVAAALIDSDGRVLIGQRPAGKARAGLWEFPGGKLEPGETPEQGLIRELEEELGIVAKADCLAPFVTVTVQEMCASKVRTTKPGVAHDQNCWIPAVTTLSALPGSVTVRA